MKMTLKESLAFTALSLLMPCLLLWLQAGCATHPSTAFERQRLQGTWEGIELGNESSGKVTMTITGNSFHYQALDTNEWHQATFTLPARTSPQQLRITITDSYLTNGPGAVINTIFKIEDGTLTLLASQSQEPPKSFGVEGNRYQLRKVQPQKKNPQLPKTE
jgi:uncharacterized protein (TIGR03067 family)